MTLTKPATEIVTKTNLELDDPTKIAETTTEMICESELVVCNPTIEPIQERGTKAPTNKTPELLHEKMNRALLRLYDLEQNIETKKQLSIDLNLYQMETQ